MDETSSAVSVTVRYWAGARAAAGVEQEVLRADEVAGLRVAALAAHPDLADVLTRCSILVDSHRSDDDVVLTEGANVEVLPPFAGG